MSWEERMAQRHREREAARLPFNLTYNDPCRVRFTSDGAILYPVGRTIYPCCGLEVHLWPGEEYEHVCSDVEAFVPCACVGADMHCCVARYQRNLRYLHQKLANVLAAAVAGGSS